MHSGQVLARGSSHSFARGQGRPRSLSVAPRDTHPGQGRCLEDRSQLWAQDSHPDQGSPGNRRIVPTMASPRRAVTGLAYPLAASLLVKVPLTRE